MILLTGLIGEGEGVYKFLSGLPGGWGLSQLYNFQSVIILRFHFFRSKLLLILLKLAQIQKFTSVRRVGVLLTVFSCFTVGGREGVMLLVLQQREGGGGEAHIFYRSCRLLFSRPTPRYKI